MKQAVILAGGVGTRLRPLTYEIPKPMILVNGKPFIEYIVEWLAKHGVKEIVLCVGYLADRFKEYFGDGSWLGVKIVYSVEKDFLGTAGAIKMAEEHLQDEFFVLNGDTFLPVDLNDVYRTFRESGKSGLMVVYDNSEKAAEGNIEIDGEGKVTAYSKKEALKKGDKKIAVKTVDRELSYVDAGVYLFKKAVFSGLKPGEFVSLEADIYPELIRNGELQAYPTNIRYYDLGTPERLELIRKVFK
ncbi:MAG TPA: nucleotidyltransferase family protein [Candidatus Omnitrophota bacterium]|nr:nucleotidyltransferase family protein [Candidatus Omnitrophota bacterium]